MADTVYTDPTLITKALSKPHAEHSCHCQGCKDAVAARNLVVSRMYAFIFGQALKIAAKHHTKAEELVNVGICKIIQTFHHFDPTKKISPITYFGKIAWREMYKYATRDYTIVPPSDSEIKDSTRKDAYRAKNARSLEQVVVFNEACLLQDLGMKSRSSIIDHREGFPEDCADREDARELISRAIQHIKPHLREVLSMRLNGDSFRVISDTLKISREWARQLEMAAREEIRAYILNQNELKKDGKTCVKS